MPEHYIETHIRNIPLFSHLPPDQFARLASAFERYSFRPGEIVFQQGEPTRGLYVLVEGSGVLRHQNAYGELRDIGYPQMDEILNQEALLRDGREEASFIALTPMTVLFLSRDNLRLLMAHYPEFKRSLSLEGTPETVHFRGQRENERVIKITRQHGWAYARRAWIPAALMALLWIAALFIPLAVIQLALVAISIIIPGLLLVYLYVEWRNDMIIITDERLIRVTHTLPFKEHLNEMPIHSIHEVNYDIPKGDPFARIFDYGSLTVRTAGTAGDFTLPFIPHPKQMQQIILADRQEYTRRQEIKNRNAQRAELEKWLSQGGQMPAQPAPQPQKKQEIRPEMPPFALSFQMPSGETVYRQHYVVWIKHIVLPLVMMVAAVVLAGFDLFNPFFQILGPAAWGITALLFIGGFLWFLWAYWDWKTDYYIVSDALITITRQRPLWLQNETVQLLLNRIDNVESQREGFFEQLFNYGDLKVSLTGADKPKILTSIPNPRGVQEDISRRRSRLQQQAAKAREHEELQRIGQFFALYHEKLQQENPQAPPVPPDPGRFAPAQANYPGQVGPQPFPTQQQEPFPPPNTPPPPPAPPETLRDRTRPPSVPGQRRPQFSEGKPYTPKARDGSRPPNIPRVRPPDED